MTSDDEPVVEPDVVDAIASLGNRNRLEILLALERAQRERREQWLSMTFSELYDAVDVESTSQFSYHLDRLVGPFLAETPEGYRLTYSGDRIVRTVRSGVYESAVAFDDAEVDGTCPFCSAAALVATVDHEHFRVRCEGCETALVTDVLPRSQTRNRTPSEIVDSVGRRIWGSALQVHGGVCPECNGCMNAALESHSHDGRTFYALEHACRECGLVVHLPIEVTAALHPAAIAFFWDWGVSVFDFPLWQFFDLLATDAVTTDVDSEDPLEATVTFVVDDHRRSLTVDDSLQVSPVATDD